MYMHLATYDQANNSQCWLVNDNELFLTGSYLFHNIFIAICTFFLSSKFL